MSSDSWTHIVLSLYCGVPCVHLITKVLSGKFEDKGTRRTKEEAESFKHLYKGCQTVHRQPISHVKGGFLINSTY